LEDEMLESLSGAPIGSRGKIGILTPALGMAVLHDFARLAPDGVGVSLARVARPLQQDTVEELEAIAEQFIAAAGQFAGYDIDVLLVNITSGTSIRGLGYDQKISSTIQEATGYITTTSSTAMIRGFSSLGIRKISVVMPYIHEVCRRVVDFIEAHGIEVIHYETLELTSVREIHLVSPRDLYLMAKKAFRYESDAVFVSCAGLSVIDVVGALEADLGVPVLSTNQVGLWDALRLLTIKHYSPRHGCLFAQRDCNQNTEVCAL
jgi:maleate isomerase